MSTAVAPTLEQARSGTTAGHAAWSPARSAAGERNPWIIAWILSIATFMEVLDTSIANVSLRNIAGNLAAGIDESTWVITTYLVANAVILPVSGWLANVIGRKRFYMLCVMMFTVSSLLCGMAPSLGWLLFFRVLQGLGGGGLAPCEQSMLADTFPPEKRGQAFALYGVAVVVAPTLGPTLGGWITDVYSWHWIFLINVPVGLISLLLTWRYVVEPQTLQSERRALLKKGLRIDFLGFILVAIGLASLEVTLSNGERHDWFESPFVRTFAILSATSLIAMVIWEWSIARDPVVDVKLLGNRNFGVSMLMMFTVGFVLYSSTTLLPLLLQGSHGYTSLLAGQVLTPGGLATLLVIPLVGALTRVVKLRTLLAIGLLSQALALYHMSGFSAELSFGDAVLARVLQSAGMGFMFIPITTLSYHGLAGNKNSAASSMLNVVRNIGGSVGIALTNTWLAQRTQFHHSVMSEHINPYNPLTNAALAGFRALSPGSVDPGGQSGLVTIDLLINRQASILAFNDVCWLLAIIVACIILLIPLLANVKAEGGASAH